MDRRTCDCGRTQLEIEAVTFGGEYDSGGLRRYMCGVCWEWQGRPRLPGMEHAPHRRLATVKLDDETVAQLQAQSLIESAP